MLIRFLLVAALTAGFGSAQRSTGRATNPGNTNTNPNRDPFGTNRNTGNRSNQQRDVKAASRYDSLAAKLELDKDQKKVVRQLFEQYSKEAEPIRQEMAKANHELYLAMKEGKSDADLSQMVEKQSALYAKMTALETRAFAAMYKQLDNSQQKRAEEVMPRMAGFFQTKKWSSPE
jgi:hypothetical protein